MPRSTRTRPGQLDPIAILRAWDRPNLAVSGASGHQVDRELTTARGQPQRRRDREEAAGFAGTSDGASRTRTGDLLGAMPRVWLVCRDFLDFRHPGSVRDTPAVCGR